MDQETMNSAISVFEGMNEDEAESCDRCCTNGIDSSAFNPAHHLHPAIHKII